MGGKGWVTGKEKSVGKPDRCWGMGERGPSTVRPDICCAKYKVRERPHVARPRGLPSDIRIEIDRESRGRDRANRRKIERLGKIQREQTKRIEKQGRDTESKGRYRDNRGEIEKMDKS